MLQMPNNGNTKSCLGGGRKGDCSRAVIEYEPRQVSKGNKHSSSEEKNDQLKGRDGPPTKSYPQEAVGSFSLSISGKRYARRKQGDGEGKGRDEPKGKP